MQISYNKNGGGTIIYDKNDWLADMDTTSAGQNHGNTGGNPLIAGIDSFRKYGYATLPFNPADVSGITAITTTITNGIMYNGTGYFIGGGLVYQLTAPATGTITNNGTFPHTINHAHASESASDICTYYNGSTALLFYSFSDATDWDVGTYNYGAGTFDDDFMSTVPTTPLASPYLAGGAGYPHPMIVGDDDVLYIGDRNFVHAYDRATNTFSAAVLTLPAGWIVTCFAKTQDLQLAIGTYQSSVVSSDLYARGDARVWFWSYLALDPDYSRDLRDNYVSEIISWQGTIAAFTSGRKSLTQRGVYKLQVLDGSEFKIIKSWQLGGLPVRGGVDNAAGDLYWNSGSASSTSYLYAYIKRPDNGQYVLSNFYSQESDSGGVFRFLTASSIYHVGFGTSTDKGMRYFSSGYAPNGILQGEVASPSFSNIQKGDLTSVTVKFGDTFSGGRSFSLRANIDYTDVELISAITTLTTTRQVQIKTRSDGSPLGQFNSIQPSIYMQTGSAATDAPEVEYIKFEYEAINL